MESEVHSLYLTLSSGDLVPSTSESKSDFSTQLFKRLVFMKDMFEVGLTQVIYKLPHIIFEGIESLHYVQVWSTKESGKVVNVTVRDSKITRTLSLFNHEMENSFEITMVFKDENIRVQIHIKYEPNLILRLPSLAKQVFGFDLDEYAIEHNKPIIAENFVNQKLYSTLEMNSKIPMEIVANAEKIENIYFTVFDKIEKTTNDNNRKRKGVLEVQLVFDERENLRFNIKSSYAANRVI